LGPSYFKRSTLGKESLGEGVKLPELDGGGLGLSLLLDRGLPKLISLVLHLGNQHSHTGIHSSVKSEREGGNLLLSGGAVLFDLADGVAGNLVLEWTGDLAQGTEIMLGVLLDATFGADGFSAGLAVGVDFHANVLLTAGNPLHLHFPLQHIMNRDQLVSRSRVKLPMDSKTGESHILTTLGAVHRRILLTASLTFHLVDILHRGGEGSREGVNEHTSSEGLHSLVGRLAHLTPRLLTQIALVFLKAFLTERVQAGKGLGLLDSLVAEGTLDQLGYCG